MPTTRAPSPDPELLRQITEAWEAAKAQLQTIRQAVERNAQVAQLKLESNFLSREKDQALRDFGQAVWKQVLQGKLELPSSLGSAVRAMREMERKLEEQASEINDILKEGDEVADRMRQKNTARSSPPLAQRPKKR